jgi:gamma-glutamylcyclotransferase (GGCT)/AIG2-like uncharacterized protein YtfP
VKRHKDEPPNFEEAEILLASYGTLAPGQVNHHELRSQSDRWVPGNVRGRLINEGWASGLEFPALVLDSEGPSVEVQLFESRDLISHWPRLDEFEGGNYRRVVTRVETAEGASCLVSMAQRGSLKRGDSEGEVNELTSALRARWCALPQGPRRGGGTNFEVP